MKQIGGGVLKFRERMQPKTYFDHPAEELLERFVLNQSDEAELDVIETHILACESCVTRLETLEVQIEATRLALRELHQEKVARAVAKQQAAGRRWFSVPGLSIAGVAVTAGLLIIPQFSGHRSPVAQVSLVAYRGSETPVVPKDQPLEVHLNANDLNQSKVVVSLVDGQGLELWTGGGSVRGTEVNVQVPKIVDSGAHFFRIYEPQPKAQPRLLREFAFQVK